MAPPLTSDLVEPPATPHLAWLGKSRPRGKVLAAGLARAILARPVIVEEKPDGALIGIDFPDGLTPRVTRRAQVLGQGAHPQFQPLWGWLAAHEEALSRVLGQDRVLFGEWCFAQHAVRHDVLPDWFFVTDLFDRKSGRFLAADRRNALAAQMALVSAPEILRTKVDLKALAARLNASESALGHGRPAGLVVRLEQGDHLIERAQLVCAEVADAPDEPATRKTLERNALGPAASLR